MTGTTTTTKSTPTGATASWNNAKKYAAAMGYIPSSFNTAVRSLITDHFANNAAVRPVTKYQVARLLNGPTFKAMIYRISKDLRGPALADKKFWTVGTMIDAFTPLDIAAILSSFVFYRKSKKLVDERSWNFLQERIERDMALAGEIGNYIPDIGVGVSLISNGYRYFGLSAMAIQSKEIFPKFKQQVYKSDSTWHTPVEVEHFGCSSVEIAVFLLSSFGFGVEIGNGFSQSHNTETPTSLITDALTLKMRASSKWLEGALAGKGQPLEKLNSKFFPSSADKPKLQAKLEAKFASPGPIWLEACKEELTAANAPELFASRPTDDKAKFEVPEELQEIFSLEEITAMQEEDFDDLVDQMDEEQEVAASAGTNVVSDKDISDLEGMVD